MIPAGVFVNISSENLQGLRSLFNLGASQAQQQGIFWEGSPAGLAAAVIEFRDGVGGDAVAYSTVLKTYCECRG